MNIRKKIEKELCENCVLKNDLYCTDKCITKKNLTKYDDDYLKERYYLFQGDMNKISRVFRNTIRPREQNKINLK